jgi:hypothetical protein
MLRRQSDSILLFASSGVRTASREWGGRVL